MLPEDDFTGGSLSEVDALEDRIIKRYSGSIDRGSEKLHNEYKWLCAIPTSLMEEMPLIFPKAIRFNIEQGKMCTELHISRLHRLSLSKAILKDLITADRTRAFFKTSLDVLINKVYSMRNGVVEPDSGYSQYHSSRITLAKKYLRRLPYMEPILNAASITVNGTTCPSINQFLSWLDDTCHKIFLSTTLLSIHGNYHLDNILVDWENSASPNTITFIDPRGDLLGYPHYDIGKLLITLEGYYDEIHYGYYELTARRKGNSYDISLQIDERHNPHYEMCLRELNGWLDKFSEVEKVQKRNFQWMILTTECIHILSFCFYHAFGPGSEPNRIRAFIAVFALLVKRLFKMWEAGQPDELQENRLSLR